MGAINCMNRWLAGYCQVEEPRFAAEETGAGRLSEALGKYLWNGAHGVRGQGILALHSEPCVPFIPASRDSQDSFLPGQEVCVVE